LKIKIKHMARDELARLSRDELELALRATDAPAARLVCRGFRDVLGPAVGLVLAAMLPCDPSVAGRALARRFATTRAALDFLALIRLCCRHQGVVAGSAALFVERACRAHADEDPAWLPGDVDCFFDDPQDARRLLDELVARPGQSRSITVDRAGTRSRDRFTGTLPRPWLVDASVDPQPLGDSVIYGIQVGGTALQLVVQKLVPGVPARTVVACDCHRMPATGCRACMHVGGVDRDESYASVWPARAPHARFDLDAVCVAIRRADGTAALEIDRLCGGDRPALTLRPQAVWSVDRDGAPQLHPPEVMERIIRRVNKYVTRGFNRVIVPREFHLRLDPPVRVAVPELFLQLLGNYMSHSQVRLTIDWGEFTTPRASGARPT
jgi:hypothetical protein